MMCFLTSVICFVFFCIIVLSACLLVWSVGIEGEPTSNKFGVVSTIICIVSVVAFVGCLLELRPFVEREEMLKQECNVPFDANGQEIEIVHTENPNVRFTYKGKCSWTTWGTKYLCVWIEDDNGKKSLIRFDNGFSIRMKNEQDKAGVESK